MTDTKRSLSNLQDILADNTAQDVSAQDLRDFLVSVYLLDTIEVSVTTTATLSLGKMHVCSGTSADYTVTLPTASGNAGQMIGIRMSNALTKLVTVDGDGSETIDGLTSRVMWAGESVILMSDGTEWVKIAGKSKPMRFSMQSSSNTSVTSGNTRTKLTLGTLNYGLPTGYASTVNSEITIPRTGFWLCTALPNNAGNGGGSDVENFPSVSINGSVHHDLPGMMSDYGRVGGSIELLLNASDIVTARMTQYSGVTKSFGCRLWVTEIIEW